MSSRPERLMAMAKEHYSTIRSLLPVQNELPWEQLSVEKMSFWLHAVTDAVNVYEEWGDSR